MSRRGATLSPVNGVKIAIYLHGLRDVPSTGNVRLVGALAEIAVFRKDWCQTKVQAHTRYHVSIHPRSISPQTSPLVCLTRQIYGTDR